MSVPYSPWPRGPGSAFFPLRSLARSRMSSQEVGTRGMPVLINVLKEDQADLEILHAALEALYTVCSPKKKTPDADDLGIMFTEIFVKVGSLAPRHPRTCPR